MSEWWHKWSLDKIQDQINELHSYNDYMNEDGYQPLVLEDEHWLWQMVKYLEETYDQFPSF